jgi:antitoxin component of MazEF toxin-antitoxin module
MIQSIFQVGNSNVVSIPSRLLQEIGMKKGQKVTVDRIPDTDAIIVRPVVKKQTVASSETKEFQQWLNSFLKEDAQLLDELAHR